MRVALTMRAPRLARRLIAKQRAAWSAMAFIIAATNLTAANAGDPCPIDLVFFDFTPPWRDRLADLRALDTKRSFLGLTFGEKDSRVVVTGVVPEGPADRAGLKTGDELLRIAKRDIDGKKSANNALDGWLNAAARPDDVEVRRGKKRLTFTIEPALRDPLMWEMFRMAEKEECRDVHLGVLDETQRRAVMQAAFKGTRGFQCKTAHRGLGGALPPGSLVVIRGGRRVLVILAGWKSRCVAVADYDGENFRPASIRKLLDQATRAYVEDRFRNP